MIDDELEYEDAREVKDAMEKLFDSRGWQIARDFMQRRYDIRQRELYSFCPGTMEEVAAFNRLYGGLEELRLIPEMLAALLSEAASTVREHMDTQEEENA